jgi:hypothetical protein
MKKILSFVSTAALCLAFAACQVPQPEDVFSTAPVAPELQAHGDILLTTGTTDEDIVFVWTAYRNLPAGLNYEFFMEHGESPVSLSNGHDTYYKTGKAAFRDLVLSSFNDLPENDTFPLTFYVRVTNDGTVYKSNSLSVNVYAYGDGVAPEVSVTSDAVELDPANPTGEVALLTWSPARLVFGEEVTYNVYMVVGDGEPVLLKEGLTETSYSTTVDELNEAVIAAGGAEDAEVPVKFIVEAVCESLPNGVEAAAAEMTVKTYVSTFPEVLYIPGSHQGWDPKTAPTIALSSKVKGYYEGIVNLTTADNSDVEFKFCVIPDWGGDFGGKVTVGGKDGVYVSAEGTVGVSDNIKVPSGKYVIKLNKKFNTISMVSIASVGIIGTAVGGWGDEIPMTWNEQTNVFTVETALVPGEYKFRLNNDWDFSIDDTYGVNGGGGNFNTSNEGNYKIQLNMSKHPYTVKFINLSFPESVGVTGSHQGWNPATAPRLNGDGEGHYEGFLNMVNPEDANVEFKFTPNRDWSAEYAGTLDNLVTSGGANIKLPNGYYKLTLDLTEMKGSATLINTVEICGSFTGWGVDPAYYLTYSADTDSWKIENVEIPAGGQWKFRMNDDGDWAVNLGYGTLDDLVQNGANIADTEPGFYTIELFLASTPYHATLTKTGESEKPKWGNRLVVAGDYSGHSWSGSDDPKLRGDHTGKFQGPLTMYNMTYGFKFVHDGAWTGMSTGEPLNWTLAIGAGDNMTLPNGTYWFNVDMEEGTATAFAITKVGLIGSFNGWSGDVEMAFDEATLTYSGTFTATEDAPEFKVRFNGSWDYSLGDDPADLNCINAGNVYLNAPGTYNVVLDMAHNSPSLTVTKQ